MAALRHPGRRALRVAAAVLAALLCVELASFAAVRALAWRKPDMFYAPRPVSREEYARYVAERDPLLGWPRPKRLVPPYYDAAGSRVVPAFPDPQRSKT